MAKEESFVALSECHLLNEAAVAEMAYYPNFARFWESVNTIMRVWCGREIGAGSEMPRPVAASLIRYMDLAGVDVAFALREPAVTASHYESCMSTNAFVLQQIEPYPGRLYLECNCGPVLRRGVKEAIWELEFLVRQHGAKLCKLYAPEDEGPLNDRRLWPFYEKCCELDIPVTGHTGTAYLPPLPDRNTLPLLLDEVCLDFPDLKIIAYHMGWPYTSSLIALAGKHPNLYLSLSGIAGYYARAPYRGYHALGQALEWAGPDKIVLGCDLPFDEIPRIANWARNLEMPEELQAKWGYPAITPETRAKILGLNLARLAKIEPVKRAPAAG